MIVTQHFSFTPVMDKEFHESTASAAQQSQAANVSQLCIYDFNKKIKLAGKYDIGGVSFEGEKDSVLWFYFTVELVYGKNCLLDLFVYHKEVGKFAIWVSSNNNAADATCMNRYYFRSDKPGEHHIKTYSFPEEYFQVYESLPSKYFIPIKIETQCSHCLDLNLVQKIKSDHSFGELLTKKERCDFTLESPSGRKFETHKIILTAHSAILRDLIRKSSSNSIFLDMNDTDIEILLGFLYTGAVKNLMEKNCLNIMNIAVKFKLSGLDKLARFLITQQMTVENAVDIAVLLHRSGLDDQLKEVFDFIDIHNDVMDTNGWKNLDDVLLTKKYLQYKLKK